MAAYNKFNQFSADLGLQIHQLNSNTLKYMLSNVAPVATNAVLTDLTEISAGSGYSAGGTAVGSNAYSQTGGTATLTGSNVVFTSSGTIGPLRYTALYNSTASGKNLIQWYDYGSSISLSTGETLTINVSGGIFSLT